MKRISFCISFIAMSIIGLSTLSGQVFNGPVGIGTTAQLTEQFEVAGNSILNGNVEFPGDHYLMNDLSSTAGGYIRFYSNPNAIVSNTLTLSGGSNPLQMASNIKFMGTGYLLNSQSESVLGFQSGTPNGIVRPLSVHRSLYFNHGNGPSLASPADLSLSFGNGGSGTFSISRGDGSGNQTQLLRLDNAGTLQVGTASNRNDLSVFGDINGHAEANNADAKFHIHGNTASTDGPYVVFNGIDVTETHNGNTVNTGGSLHLVSYEKSTDAPDDVGISFATKIGSSWNTGNDYRENMVIQKDGKVRIGTPTIPSGYLLAVEDGIITERVRVAVAGSPNWADYVFEEDYELRKLEDVAAYIAENKHLPDVPSAEEVVENGFDLGSMDATLLQKIEELTLYMIEANEKIKSLETELSLLKAAK